MRKILIYIFIFMLLIFAIPFIFTNVQTEETGSVVENELNVDENFEYGKIKLYHNSNGNIEELGMNQYLYGVVASEMPASYEIEALKAQAVVARTYTIYKIKNGSKHVGADICDNSNCCQAWITKENRLARWEVDKRDEYWNKIVNAVDTTNNQYITYNGEVINAFFHSNSGGKTELAVNVWGGNLPYLQIVETSGEESYSAYKSEVILSKDEFVVKMNENFKDFKINFSDEDCIKILDYTESGRIKKIKIGNKELSGVDARKIFGLKSSNFSVEINDKIKFFVIGYGHGVGLSQSGSDALAKQGYTYDKIIKYYYKDIQISE
ncbi:MAG: stage II sporulation protein D [Clostridia bacterium]|nr:stage II sporulation protein D [Clostridia bacterium]